MTCGRLRWWGPLGAQPTKVVSRPGPVANRPHLVLTHCSLSPHVISRCKPIVLSRFLTLVGPPIHVKPRVTLWFVETLCLGSWLTILLHFSSESPAHTLKPTSVEFVNKWSYASIYSIVYLVFVQELTVKSGQNRPSTPLALTVWSLIIKLFHVSFPWMVS